MLLSGVIPEHWPSGVSEEPGDRFRGGRVTFRAMPRRVACSVVATAVLGSGGATCLSQQAAAAAPTPSGSAAIRAVLASRPGKPFRYFPHVVGTSRCAIPFVWGSSIRGTCTTGVTAADPSGSPVRVSFTERWPWRKFHYSGTPRRPLHHRWVFGLQSSGKVVLVSQSGDFPPNYAR